NVVLSRLLQVGAGVFREPSTSTFSTTARSPTAHFAVPIAELAQQRRPAQRGYFVQGTVRVGPRAQLLLFGQHTEDLITRNVHWSGYANLSLILGSRSTATMTYDQEAEGTTVDVALQRSLPFGPGWGYRVGATSEGESTNSGFALVEGQTRFGYGAFRYDQTSGTKEGSYAVDLSGSIAFIGNRPLLARSLDSSFALVQVPGARRVRIYANNQEVGRTNRWGNLLVPDLVPYHASSFTIRDEDIPVDYELNDAELLAALPYRGGAVVRFEGRRVRAFRGRVLFRTASGDAAPAYGTISVDVDGQRQESPIGSDGGFYSENVAPARYPPPVDP